MIGAVAALVVCGTALASVDGGSPDAADAGVVPSSAWLQGPSATREPLPSDPPLAPDRRILEAAREDAGTPLPRPIRSPFDPWLGALEQPDAGSPYVVVSPFGEGDGGVAPEWLPDAVASRLPRLTPPPLTVALPRAQGEEVTDPMVNAATGTPNLRSQSGRALDVVDQQDLARSGVRTTPEALELVPGVFVARPYYGGPTATVHGLGGNQVLVTVDGVRMSHALSRPGYGSLLATVDPYAVERLEVLRGAAATLHGHEAVGGVVAVQEREPERSEDLVVHTDGSGFFRTQDQGRGVRLYAEGGLGPFAASLGGDLRDFQDVLGGRTTGNQKYTGYQDLQLQARTRLSLWNQELTVAYDAARLVNVPLTYLCPYTRPRDAADCRYLEEQYRDLAYAGLKLRPGVVVETVDAKLSYQQYRETLTRTRWDIVQQTRNKDLVRTFGGYVRAHTFTLTLGPIWVRALVGGELYHDVVESQFYRRALWGGTADTDTQGHPDPTLATVPNGSRYTQAGTYGLLEFTFFERVGVRAGGRGSVYAAQVERRDEVTAGFNRIWWTPSAFFQGLLLLWPYATASAGVFHGYRAPNLYDVAGRAFTDLGFEYSDPAQVRPVQSLSFEADLKATLWRFDLSANVYAMRLLDAVRQRPSQFQGADTLHDEPVFRRIPGGDALVLGAEGALEARLVSALRVGGFFSYTLAETALRREPLPRSPPPNGAIRVGWLPPLGFYALALCRFALPARRLGYEDKVSALYEPNGTEQSFNFMMGGGYQFTSRSALDLFVENITNEDYRMHGSGMLMPGAGARVQLRLGF
ncbi:MAG: TonB-dependent receptor [Myxococcota bacterium]